MRNRALIVMLALSGCSQGGKEEAPAAAPVSLQAGLWEIRTEVESGRNLDHGKAVMPIEKGTSESFKACLAPADIAKPQPTLLVPSMDSCLYTNSWFSEGTLNVTMTCKKEKWPGAVGGTVRGTYTATTIDATQIVETQLVSDGDVSVTSKLTGKRLGDCPPDGAPKDAAARKDKKAA